MDAIAQAAAFAGGFALLAMISLAAAPRHATVEGFFAGRGADGAAPGLWTLVFSQVTTWIFARSLMNAAILGYYYGLPGTLAYTGYYASFLTGGLIVARIRRRGGRSVQDWLGAEFGRGGRWSYDAVIALRLLSEVFANLLVIGLIARAALPDVAGAEWAAMLGFAALALAYSMLGGLSASLRTDVAQMTLLLGVIALALPALVLSEGFSLSGVLTAGGTAGPGPGWVLLAVAALQVFSYPAHDPVMMDRGFLADPRTTRLSFLHAFWISALCILLFGLFGVQAGVVGADAAGGLLGAWQGMFSPATFLLILLALMVSALSTLDSALSSAARLTVEELGLLPRGLAGGRAAMALFALAGAALTLWGNQTLFDAVAVSGTASMFLAPVMWATLILGRRLAPWAYAVAFAAAMMGAMLYLVRDALPAAEFLSKMHKYTLLLVICAGVLAIGGLAAALGSSKRLRARA